MNRINTGYVVDPNIQQPWTTKSLDFLQNTVNTMSTVLAKTFYPGEASSYILYGCEAVNVSGSTWDIFAGYIFTQPNYEVAYVAPVNNIVLGTGDTIVLTRTVSNDGTADPLTFSDGIPRNVHNVISYVPSAGVSGSSDINYFELLNAQNKKMDWNTVGNDGGATAYSTGWTGSSGQLQYTINQDGMVTLRGFAIADGTAANQVFFLPSGFRPTRLTEMPIMFHSTPGTPLAIKVLTTGEVTVYGTSITNGDIITLDGVNFYTS